MEQQLSNEIISAEIVFSQPNKLMKLPTGSEEYQLELASINKKLEKYANNADRYDYMVAVASGILCGILDSKIADVINRVLANHKENILNKRKEIFETIEQQAKNESKKTTVSALLASILCDCLNQKTDGAFVRNAADGIAEINTSRFVEIFGAAAFRSILKWLAKERKPEEIDQSDFPETIKKLLHQLQKSKKIRDFLKNPEMPDLSPKKLEQMGIPVVLLNLFDPEIKNANGKLRNYSSKYENKSKQLLHDLIGKAPTIKIDTNFLGKIANQAISVLANELIVRGFYFIRHLMEEFNRCGDIDSVNWDVIIPFDNRTVVRMMSIAALTFTSADMLSAAVRAEIESGGNKAIFLQKYFTNINVVGVGRAIIAVYKDVSMEWEEASLIRERRLLTEKFSAEQVEAILAYRKQMEKVVETYLAEDLETFLTGAEEIEAGLETNNSNQVIHGNVTIQRILGREPQFTNQAEFDNLMDADEAFIL